MSQCLAWTYVFQEFFDHRKPQWSSGSWMKRKDFLNWKEMFYVPLGPIIHTGKHKITTFSSKKISCESEHFGIFSVLTSVYCRRFNEVTFQSKALNLVACSSVCLPSYPHSSWPNKCKINSFWHELVTIYQQKKALMLYDWVRTQLSSTLITKALLTSKCATAECISNHLLRTITAVMAKVPFWWIH